MEINEKQEMKVTRSEGEDSGQLLETLVKNSQKQLFYSRITAAAVLVVAAAVVICLIILVPAVMKTVSEANAIMVQASDTISLADTAIESITEMSGSITTMGNNMDNFVTENAESVAEVMEKLDSVDFEGLNGAIEDLGNVVEPLANFFGKFK